MYSIGTKICLCKVDLKNPNWNPYDWNNGQYPNNTIIFHKQQLSFCSKKLSFSLKSGKIEAPN